MTLHTAHLNLQLHALLLLKAAWVEIWGNSVTGLPKSCQHNPFFSFFIASLLLWKPGGAGDERLMMLRMAESGRPYSSKRHTHRKRMLRYGLSSSTRGVWLGYQHACRAVCVCLCVCRWQAESRCRRWSISNIRSNHNDQELDHHQTSTGQHILARGSPVCVCVWASGRQVLHLTTPHMLNCLTLNSSLSPFHFPYSP